jgi:hypothetical protein
VAGEQLLKLAGRALGLELPRAVSSALALAVLEHCAARWFFPVLQDPAMIDRWARQCCPAVD